MNPSKKQSEPDKTNASSKSKQRSNSQKKSALNLAEALGSDRVAAQGFTIYLPSKDKDGKKIKHHAAWIKEAKLLLAEINGGATVMPPSDGVWVNPDTGQVIEEPTVVVYSFIQAEPFQKHLPEIRNFLHRFGRETNQGEVSCELGGFFYRIVTFDEK